MCIIVYVPSEMNLPTKEILEHCWDQNPHNGGFMYIRNNRVVIEKWDKKDNFIDAVYARKAELPDTPIVMHMRFATHGSVRIDNTHPFRVNKRMAFVHNGTIGRLSPDKQKDGDISDTRKFKEHILKRLPHNFLDSFLIRMFLEHYIGYSKIVIMENSGEVTILNEDKGEWVEGIWFSNDYYKTKRASLQPTNTLPAVRYVNGTMSNWSRGPQYIENPVERPKRPGEVSKVYSGCCDLCGCNLPYKDEMTVMFKLSKERTHRSSLCDECHNMLYTANVLTTDKFPDVCCVCGEKTQPFGQSSYTDLYDCIDLTAMEVWTNPETMENDPPEYPVLYMNSRCAFDTFRKDTKYYSTGYCGWFVNAFGGEILPKDKWEKLLEKV